MHHLIVLDSQVVARLFQMRNLHEVSRSERLLDVGVVVPRVEVRAHQLGAHARGDAHLQQAPPTITHET